MCQSIGSKLERDDTFIGKGALTIARQPGGRKREWEEAQHMHAVPNKRKHQPKIEVINRIDKLNRDAHKERT